MIENSPPARDEEAARWFAALRRGVMSLEERQSFEAWRRNRLNRRAIAEIEECWQSLESLGNCFGELAENAEAKRASTKFVSRPALVAALCAVSLVIGVLSYTGNESFWTRLDWTDR